MFQCAVFCKMLSLDVFFSSQASAEYWGYEAAEGGAPPDFSQSSQFESQQTSGLLSWSSFPIQRSAQRQQQVRRRQPVRVHGGCKNAIKKDLHRRSSGRSKPDGQCPTDIELLLRDYGRAREEARTEIARARERLKERTEMEKKRLQQEIKVSFPNKPLAALMTKCFQKLFSALWLDFFYSTWYNDLQILDLKYLASMLQASYLWLTGEFSAEHSPNTS